MAFKYIIAIFSLAATANAGLVTQSNTYTIATPIASHQHHEIHPVVESVASTQQKVFRSFDITVSGNSKIIDTPYSSVHNVYTPSLTKTVNYASPALAKAVYAAPVPTTATLYAPRAFPLHYSQPTQTVPSTIYSYASPAVTKAVTYAAVPAVANFNHDSGPTIYSHGAPVVSGYGSIQSVRTYSPAEKVSHISFDAFGTHWGI